MPRRLSVPLFALFVLPVLVALSACGPTMVTADVTRFHTLPAAAPRGVAILPEGPQRGSLEFRTYAAIISDTLARQGWRPVADATADVVVTFAYGADSGHTQVWSEPAWGPPAWGRGPPYYGSWPGSDWITSTVSYNHVLHVVMWDGPAYRRGERVAVYEGRATAETGSPVIQPVMPYLIAALLDDFPGPSGVTVRVKVPVAGT